MQSHSCSLSFIPVVWECWHKSAVKSSTVWPSWGNCDISSNHLRGTMKIDATNTISASGCLHPLLGGTGSASITVMIHCCCRRRLPPWLTGWVSVAERPVLFDTSGNAASGSSISGCDASRQVNRLCSPRCLHSHEIPALSLEARCVWKRCRTELFRSSPSTLAWAFLLISLKSREMAPPPPPPLPTSPYVSFVSWLQLLGSKWKGMQLERCSLQFCRHLFLLLLPNVHRLDLMSQQAGSGYLRHLAMLLRVCPCKDNVMQLIGVAIGALSCLWCCVMFTVGLVLWEANYSCSYLY